MGIEPLSTARQRLKALCAVSVTGSSQQSCAVGSASVSDSRGNGHPERLKLTQGHAALETRALLIGETQVLGAERFRTGWGHLSLPLRASQKERSDFIQLCNQARLGIFFSFCVCLPALTGEYLTTGLPGKPSHLFLRQDLGALFFPGRISNVWGVSQVNIWWLSLHLEQHMQVSPFSAPWAPPLHPGSKMNPEAANQGIRYTTSK